MGTTALGFLNKLKSANLLDLTGDIVDENTEAVKTLNKKQMLKGLNNQGQSLPSIIGDPWFKRAGADYRYAAFKHKLFPETPFGISNFTVINVYHNSINVRRLGRRVNFDASAPFADAIANKTGNSTLGLNKNSQGIAWQEIVKSPLVHRTAAIIGCKVG